MASAAPLLLQGGLSLLGGLAGGKGASKAAKIQAQAYQQGIGEQQREYDQSRQDYSPFLNAGSSATEQIRRLLGLGDSNTGVSVNGNPALSADQQQGGALSNLHDSALYHSIYDSGEEAIEQNAAATGGLRGGNTQTSLYKLGSDTFSQTLQQQLSNLFGLSSGGLSAANGTTSAGVSTSNNVSNLLGQQGGANATVAAAPYAGFTGALQGIGGALGNYTSTQQIMQLLAKNAGSGAGF